MYKYHSINRDAVSHNCNCPLDRNEHVYSQEAEYKKY